MNRNQHHQGRQQRIGQYNRHGQSPHGSPAGGGAAAAAEAEARARARAAARARREQNRNREQHAANPVPPANPVNPDPGPSLGGDPGVMAADDARQRARANADAQLGYTLGGLGTSYGFDASGGVDPNNPFSRAALLQDSYRRQVRSNRGGYAAAGQLYSGALQNAQNESGRSFNIGYDQLVKGYQGQVGQAHLDRRATYSSADDDYASALLAALLNSTGGK